jgi:hypothetical protein
MLDFMQSTAKLLAMSVFERLVRNGSFWERGLGYGGSLLSVDPMGDT